MVANLFVKGGVRMSGTNPIAKDEKVITNPLAVAEKQILSSLNLDTEKSVADYIKEVKKSAGVTPLK